MSTQLHMDRVMACLQSTMGDPKGYESLYGPQPLTPAQEKYQEAREECEKAWDEQNALADMIQENPLGLPYPPTRMMADAMVRALAAEEALHQAYIAMIHEGEDKCTTQSAD